MSRLFDPCRAPARGALLRWALLLCLVAPALPAQPPRAGAIGPRLNDLWVRWAADLEPLMSPEERSFFLALDDDRSRELFAEAFWRGRGEAAAERWSRNAEEARRLGWQSSRRRAVLLLGKPSRIEPFPGCGGLRRLELWSWGPWALARQGVARPTAAATAVFVQAISLDYRSMRPWPPGDAAALAYSVAADATVASLLERAATGSCFTPAQIARLGSEIPRAVSLDSLRARAPWPPGAEGWLDELRGELAQDDGGRWPDARLELSFPGAFNDSTIVRGRLVVRARRLAELAPGQLLDRVTITGDLYRGGRLVESFEHVHHVAGSAPDRTVPLDFYRRLRPGGYALDLRAVDGRARTLLRQRLDLEVPERQSPAPPPAGRPRGYSHLARPRVIALTTFPSVELLPASDEGTGSLRLHAITAGGPIDAVEFRLDGRRLAVDGEAPYSASVGPSPARRRAEVIALDPAARPLARHARWLEPADRAFEARFARPLEGARAPVAVSLPAGARIERFECFHGRRPTASRAAPPWECPVPASYGASGDYLSVRVTLAGGDSAEDVVFLGPHVEEVEVRLAELYVSVFDSRNRPVAGLGPGDFRLSDSAGELRLESAEPLADLPLNVAILMDISSSMGRDVAVAVASAQRFFDRVLEQHDLAAMLAFNHDLHRLVPFTADPEHLRHGPAGLRAGGATRLHDAIVYALFQFTGLGNRRALILLSDGADVGSDYPFEQVRDEAVRAGVLVYPVFLGIADETTRLQLDELAFATGGRSFAAPTADRLDEVFRQIAAELRAQYLLVYRPRRPQPAGRRVEVELLRPGLRAGDVHGRYR